MPPVWSRSAAARGPLALEADGLGKDFRLGRGQVLHAVRDVSLSLYRGAVVALVGESGSGKSTVARHAGRAGAADRGHHPARRPAGRTCPASAPSAQYKSEVQLVFQDPFASLNPAHTVRYHIERPLRLHRGRCPGSEVGEQAAALMEQVRLSPAEQVPGEVPARAVRRTAAARRVRQGAGRGAERAAGRRAGLDAGRVDPARDAGAARRPAQAVPAGHALHHPRHRLGPLLRRRGARHVRRADRRARARRGRDAAARAPVHPAAGQLRTRPRQPRRRAAQRRKANLRTGTGPPAPVPARPPRALPVQPAVPVRGRPVPRRGAAAAADLRVQGRRLLAARRRSPFRLSGREGGGDLTS